jgi:hypothetical protein
VTAVLSKILSLRNGAAYLKGISEERVTGGGMRKVLAKYGEYARDCYVQGVIDQAEVDKDELATLIRQPEFYSRVVHRVVRQYEKDARAAGWLKEALPPISS